jgi:CxxC motif-containing protein
MERKLVCISCPLGCRLTVTWEDESYITVKGNRCAKGESYAQEEILAPKRVVTATVAVAGRAVAAAPAGAAAAGGASAGASAVAEATAAADGALRRAESPRRLPVKTSAALLKEHIPELLNELYRMEVGAPIRCGDVLLTDIAGTGVDLVATRSLKEG